LYRGVFLDRDGTIAYDVNHTRTVDQFKLIPGVGEGIRLLNQGGLLVVVTTNQSGIARGYFSHNTLTMIHQHMHEELSKQGAHIDGVYHCPHHPQDQCLCRKPKPGMVIKASEDLRINLSESFVVGDRDADILLARATGCRAIMVDTGPKNLVQTNDLADFYAPDLRSAAIWILRTLTTTVA
jgi:D-glycero-D-manno-heptose 1,7-bisphosphate phosphatase